MKELEAELQLVKESKAADDKGVASEKEKEIDELKAKLEEAEGKVSVSLQHLKSQYHVF